MTGRAQVPIDAVSSSQWLSQWHALVSEHVGRSPPMSEHQNAERWHPVGGAPFSGSLECGALGDAGLYRLIATPHRFARSAHDRVMGSPSPLMMFLQLKGSACFEQGGQSAVLEPGDWCVLDAAEPFAIDNPTGCDHIIFTPPRPIDPVLVDLIGRSRARQCRGDQSSSRLVYTMLNGAYEQFDQLPWDAASNLAHAIASLAWHALHECCERPKEAAARDVQRSKFKAFIEKNLSEPELSVDSIAAGCGCSARSVHRAFADDPQGSVSNYIWHRRVAHCASALRNPSNVSRSVTDIALSWGFSSSSHFSRVFKRSFGTSPKAYMTGH